MWADLKEGLQALFDNPWIRVFVGVGRAVNTLRQRKRLTGEGIEVKLHLQHRLTGARNTVTLDVSNFRSEADTIAPEVWGMIASFHFLYAEVWQGKTFVARIGRQDIERSTDGKG